MSYYVGGPPRYGYDEGSTGAGFAKLQAHYEEERQRNPPPKEWSWSLFATIVCWVMTGILLIGMAYAGTVHDGYFGRWAVLFVIALCASIVGTLIVAAPRWQTRDERKLERLRNERLWAEGKYPAQLRAEQERRVQEKNREAAEQQRKEAERRRAAERQAAEQRKQQVRDEIQHEERLRQERLRKQRQ